MKLSSRMLVAMALSASLSAQQELWRSWPLAHGYGLPSTLGDLDGDGYQDVVVAIVLDIYTNYRLAIRVLSGRTGTVVYEHVHAGISASDPNPVGDVDGDGFPEFAFTFNNGSSFPRRMEVWSPHLDQIVFTALGPWSGIFGEMSFGLNLDNDGRNEVITATSGNTNSRVYAYDDNGALLYTINILQPNVQWLRGLGPVGDIDNDGAGDFGVGLVETTGRGAVQIYSGRTGSLIRTDFGTQVGDAIGWQIVPMGDIDRDSVPDYATCNNTGYRGLITIFSGATGQVIREWVDMQAFPAWKLLGGMDLDLDGVQDVFAGNGYYYNGEPSPGNPWLGRVAGFSGRDGGMLWQEVNWPTLVNPWEVRFSGISLGEGLANLGPQPGNPYPVIVVFDWLAQVISYGPPITAANLPRLRAIRVNLAGTAVSGIGCSSTATTPQIAVRRDAAGHVRATLSGAPPNAAAWLMAGPGLTLPLPLDPWAMPGCSLLVAPVLVINRATGTSGWDAGYADFTAPYTVAATGFPIALQWLVLSPSTLDFALTRRHDVRLQ